MASGKNLGVALGLLHLHHLLPRLSKLAGELQIKRPKRSGIGEFGPTI